MQAASQALKEERQQRSGYTAAAEAESAQKSEVSNAKGDKNGAKFLKNIRQDVYMDSEMGLEERLNRQKHYHDRKELRKDINDN